MKILSHSIKQPLSLPSRARTKPANKEKLNPVNAVESTRKLERDDNGSNFTSRWLEAASDRRVQIDKSLNLRAQKALSLYASYQSIPAENGSYTLQGIDIYV